MKLFFALVLVLPLLASAQTDRKAQILKLRKILETRYYSEHEAQKLWLKNPQMNRPELDPQLRRIYQHLSRLYQLTGSSQGYRFYGALANEPKPVVVSAPETTAPSPSASFIDLSARMTSHAVKIETAGGTGTRFFNAVGVGAGYTHFFTSQFALATTGTLTRGDIKEGDVSQKDAVLYSLRFVPSYVIPAGENVSIFLGLPLSFSKLEADESSQFKLTSERSFDVGGEAGLRYQLDQRFSLGVSYGYSTATRSLGLGIGYHL